MSDVSILDGQNADLAVVIEAAQQLDPERRTELAKYAAELLDPQEQS